MKKIYTLLTALTLSTQISWGQCSNDIWDPVSFSAFELSTPTLDNDNGTPSDPTDDSYSAMLSFNLATGSGFGGGIFGFPSSYSFNYAGGTIFENGPFIPGYRSFAVFLTGTTWPSTVSGIIVNNSDLNGNPTFATFCPETFPVFQNGTPLNIVLHNFNVTNINNTNHLKWSAAEPQNIKSISIEHSINGSDFENLYSTNNQISEYTHKLLVGNKHFYRIKFTDFENKVNYSSVASIEKSNSNTDFVVANTILEKELVVSANHNTSIVIYDMQGIEIKKLDLKGGTQTIDLSNLTAGIYVIKSNKTAIKVVKI
jgi:hypothetical protein